MSAMRPASALFLWTVAVAASAWPVDASVDVAPGVEKFVRVGDAAWVDVVDPSVVDAELFPSGELMLTPKREGETLVGLMAQGAFRVLRVRVRRPGATPPVLSEALKKQVTAVCPGAVLAASSLKAKVPDARCRTALLAVLRDGPWTAGELELEFDVAALQDQLSDLTRAIGPAVRAYYRGAGLVLEGTVTPEEHRRVLWEVFRRSAGRLALEDRLRTPVADAGTD